MAGPLPDFELADPTAVTWSAGQIRGPRTLPVRIPPATRAVGQFHPGQARAAKRGELTPAQDHSGRASLLDESRTIRTFPSR